MDTGTDSLREKLGWLGIYCVCILFVCSHASLIIPQWEWVCGGSFIPKHTLFGLVLIQ